jgi:hypothetical protein
MKQEYLTNPAASPAPARRLLWQSSHNLLLVAAQRNVPQKSVEKPYSGYFFKKKFPRPKKCLTFPENPWPIRPSISLSDTEYL